MAILLIRHGETALNAARIVQPFDTPLNERGQVQAAQLAQRLTAHPVGHVLHSDQPRAQQTADAILACVRVPSSEEPLLRERDFGTLRGQPYSAIDLRVFAGIDGTQAGEDEIIPPEGESWGTFHDRAARAWSRVVARAAMLEGDLAVVTHGLVLSSFARYHLGLENAPTRWGNTSLTIVDRSPPHHGAVVNCTEHLTGDVADDVRTLSGI